MQSGGRVVGTYGVSKSSGSVGGNRMKVDSRSAVLGGAVLSERRAASGSHVTVRRVWPTRKTLDLLIRIRY